MKKITRGLALALAVALGAPKRCGGPEYHLLLYSGRTKAADIEVVAR